MTPQISTSATALLMVDPIPQSDDDCDDTENENAPLLSTASTHSSHSFCIDPTRSPNVVIGIIFTVVFVLAFGGGLISIPSLRVMENIICHYYYNELPEGQGRIGFDETIEEEMCKGTEVQEQLNVLIAVLWFLGCIPGLVTTIPYGLLADRWGRKPVFALSICGMILAGCYNFLIMAFWKVISIKMIWLSPLFILIGGGEMVTGMMFFAISNDVTTETNRATMFLVGGSASLFADIIAPSVAATLMPLSPWIPIGLGMAMLVIGTSLVIFIPETLHLKLNASASLTPDSASDISSVSDSKIDKETSFLVAAKTQFVATFERIHSSTKILQNTRVVLLLVTFIISPVGRCVGDLSARYVSNRYHWEFRKVGFLFSLRAFINILLNIAVIPAFSHALTVRLSFSGKEKDLLLARFSAIFLVVGTIMMGASPTVAGGTAGMVVWTLGTGFTALTRSLITTLVDQQHVGRLYAAISVVETSCAMGAGPVVAALYAVGLKWQGGWVGLPFYLLTFVSFFSGCAVWIFGCVSDRQKGDIQTPLNDEDEERIALPTD